MAKAMRSQVHISGFQTTDRAKGEKFSKILRRVKTLERVILTLQKIETFIFYYNFYLIFNLVRLVFDDLRKLIAGNA